MILSFFLEFLLTPHRFVYFLDNFSGGFKGVWARPFVNIRSIPDLPFGIVPVIHISVDAFFHPAFGDEYAVLP